MTKAPLPPNPPTGRKAMWAKFRSWPKTAQISVWALCGLIGLGAIGSASQKKTPTPVRTPGQVATTTTTAAPTTTTSAATTSSTKATAPTTTTAKASTTTTATAQAATSTTAPKVTTTTVRATTTTTRATTTTTAAPTTTTTATYVHAGSFCSPDGATGYTSAGTHMVCTTTPTDSRDRWRAG